MIYNKRVKKSRVKQVCEYLDTFNYTVLSPDDDSVSSTLVIYHVLRDLSSSKIYAIPSTSIKNFRVNQSKGVFDITIGKNKKKCVEGTKVNIWIDKEVNNWYERDGNSVEIRRQKLAYTKDLDDMVYVNGKIPKLYNVNKKYDISLLDKAVFAYGYGEFEE